jgi:hypothetical protein
MVVGVPLRRRPNLLLRLLRCVALSPDRAFHYLLGSGVGYFSFFFFGLCAGLPFAFQIFVTGIDLTSL